MDLRKNFALLADVVAGRGPHALLAEDVVLSGRRSTSIVSIRRSCLPLPKLAPYLGATVTQPRFLKIS